MSARRSSARGTPLDLGRPGITLRARAARIRSPSFSFRSLTAPATAPRAAESEVVHAGHAQLGRKDPEVAGTRRASARYSARLRHVVVALEKVAIVIERLPKSLCSLDPEQILQARRCRDERMADLFRNWPALSNADMQELRMLSDERQRLARHAGNVRRLQALR